MADLDAELARYDSGEAEPILPMQTGGRPTPGAAKITAFRVSSQDRQAREVSVARPSILLLSVLGILWAMGIAMTMAGAVLRITLRNQNLESSESVLLALLAAFAALAPVLLAIRHVRRTIWDNTSKAMDLAETLRRPVVAGLGAYGFASLLVRLMEEIVLRHATGVAWPKWDLLLGGIGVVAAVVAHHLPDLEKKNASQVK